MITVILPIEEVKSLGNVISGFLQEDGDVLVDDIFEVIRTDMVVGGLPENLLESVRKTMRENILDALVIVCLDNLIESLGNEGFNATAIKVVNGIIENDLACRVIHADVLLSSEYSFALDNSPAYYDIYSLLQHFISKHLREKQDYINFRVALLETLSNINSYGEYNMRDVISTTIVDRRTLVLFMRKHYEGTSM